MSDDARREEKVPQLQEMIANTQRNMREAQEMLAVHQDEMSEEDIADIEAKNERRERSIHEFRKEIKGEFID